MGRAERWSEIGEVGFLTGVRLLFGAYRIGGFRLFYILLQPVLLYYFLSNRVAREASLDYLRQLAAHWPDAASPTPGWRSAYRHFNAFAASALDRLAVWSNADILERIDFPNHELLRAQLATGRGALLLGSHLGNLELCRGLSLRNPELKLNILVHTRHAGMFNRMLQEVVGESAITLIEVSELNPATAIQLRQCIERGEFVAVLGDRVPHSASARCTPASFLGREANFPDGPFILASLLKCPVYTLFCVREGERYRIHSEKFADCVALPRADRQRALQPLVARFARTLEDMVQRYPLQWFNFFPFWEQE